LIRLHGDALHRPVGVLAAPDPGGLPALGVDQHRLGMVNGRRELHDPGLRRLRRAAVPLDDVHALDGHPAGLEMHAEHAALLALVVARDDLHRVALGAVQALPDGRLLPPSTRITSARRAPELSAIRRIDSCWTMVTWPFRRLR